LPVADDADVSDTRLEMSGDGSNKILAIVRQDDTHSPHAALQAWRHSIQIHSQHDTIARLRPDSGWRSVSRDDEPGAQRCPFSSLANGRSASRPVARNHLASRWLYHSRHRLGAWRSPEASRYRGESGGSPRPMFARVASALADDARGDGSASALISGTVRPRFPPSSLGAVSGTPVSPPQAVVGTHGDTPSPAAAGAPGVFSRTFPA
jgi:hypothetical protein